MYNLKYNVCIIAVCYNCYGKEILMPKGICGDCVQSIIAV